MRAVATPPERFRFRCRWPIFGDPSQRFSAVNSMRVISAVALLLSVAPLNARTAATVTPALAEPSPSPDHHEIAFVSGGDIWTVPYAGGEARLLVSNPAAESRPLYSPDGTQLAFVSTRSGNGDIYVVTLANGQLKRITWDDVNDQLDGWSRDGKWIYFSSTSRDISGMSDVYRVRATGGTPMIVAGDRYASEYLARRRRMVARSPSPRAVFPSGSGGGTGTATSTRARSGSCTTSHPAPRPRRATSPSPLAAPRARGRCGPRTARRSTS